MHTNLLEKSMQKIICALFIYSIVSGPAHAFSVSRQGRSDVSVELDALKLMPNRYTGVMRDLGDVRATCVKLQGQAQQGFSNNAAVNEFIGVLQDRRSRIHSVLPEDSVLNASLIAVQSKNRVLGQP